MPAHQAAGCVPERSQLRPMRAAALCQPEPGAQPLSLAPAWVLMLALALGCQRNPEPAALELRPPTLAEALVGLPHDRPFPVTLETDLGALSCQLDPTRTPHAVALFVGLATGRAVFREPSTGKLTRRPLYRELAFHRAIAGVMIQSGDPLGNATGYPGYRIPVERAPDDAQRLATPGALVLARYTPPPGRVDPRPPPPGHVLGSQFAVLLAPMPQLLGQVSVLGRCEPSDVARTIARDVAGKRAAHRLLRVQVGALSPRAVLAPAPLSVPRTSDRASRERP